jgi:SAM-dependent methyltransferase
MSEAEERLGYDPTSELWGEHRSRYRFAAQWVAGKRVLDVACGAGFGLEMLRAAGANAVGLDLDFDALCQGSQAQADATRLPLSDASMDVVASFETIEHVPDARALVVEAFDTVQLYGQRPIAGYRFVPYLMVHPDRSPRALAWKALNRLPYRVKDGLSQTLTGRSFYPSEADYWFDPDCTDGAHALVAVAS